MSTVDGTRIAEIVSKHESSLLTDWLKLQLAGGYSKYDEKELRDRSSHFLSLFRNAVQSGDVENEGGRRDEGTFLRQARRRSNAEDGD